jgi:hypothetical protein
MFNTLLTSPIDTLNKNDAVNTPEINEADKPSKSFFLKLAQGICPKHAEGLWHHGLQRLHVPLKERAFGVFRIDKNSQPQGPFP